MDRAFGATEDRGRVACTSAGARGEKERIFLATLKETVERPTLNVQRRIQKIIEPSALKAER